MMMGTYIFSIFILSLPHYVIRIGEGVTVYKFWESTLKQSTTLKRNKIYVTVYRFEKLRKIDNQQNRIY